MGLGGLGDLGGLGFRGLGFRGLGASGFGFRIFGFSSGIRRTARVPHPKGPRTQIIRF